MSKDIILIQPVCGKYDLFILDMPLSLLYIARMLLKEGYRVHILDQRTEKENTFQILQSLLEKQPLWIGLTVMTGEPVRHALHLAQFIREHSKIPIIWGGIHPTIMPEQTLQSPLVDYVIRGKGEISAVKLSKFFEGEAALSNVPGLSWMDAAQQVHHNLEDEAENWDELPMVPYDLVDVKKYFRVGFEKKVFSIMTSRNCPHRCTFCYNSSLKKKQRWMPDSLDYTKHQIDHILKHYRPEYLSFIDDDFFIDRKRAYEILTYLEGKAPEMKVGFRGARISDLVQLDDDFLDLMKRVNTRHINIGVESGSPRILKKIQKGITVEQTLEVNRRFAQRPSFTPLYNFFSGIPGETKEDIRLSAQLILQLVRENPYCQISGFHQYTPYPGNALFREAVQLGFPEPQSLEAWGELRFEDNAKNCPWIDAQRKRLLDTIYCMIYFVDKKYEMYFAKAKMLFKILLPLVWLYRPMAKMRLKHCFTAFPIEIFAKNLFYKIATGNV